jgi:hypothetical protein
MCRWTIHCSPIQKAATGQDIPSAGQMHRATGENPNSAGSVGKKRENCRGAPVTPRDECGDKSGKCGVSVLTLETYSAMQAIGAASTVHDDLQSGTGRLECDAYSHLSSSKDLAKTRASTRVLAKTRRVRSGGGIEWQISLFQGVLATLSSRAMAVSTVECAAYRSTARHDGGRGNGERLKQREQP